MYSESDDEEFLAAAVVLLENQKKKKKKKRNRSVWVKPWILKFQNKSVFETIYAELAISDPMMYRRCMRMSTQAFGELLELVRPQIERENTNMRQSIPAAKRLAVTLRYLATGETFLSLSVTFALGHSTVCEFVPEVCDAIYDALRDQVRSPATQDEWLAVAQHNFDRWDYPNCIGALDGKHVLIDPPPGSGTHFYNYKGGFSIVLMALVDGDIRAIYVDVGRNGQMSDGGVWGKCSLKKKIDENTINIPPPAPIPHAPNTIVPYHIVGDDAFALCPTLMKPYSANHLRGNLQRRIFNYRLSRCRNRSENFFGILANRFQVYRTPIRLLPDKAEKVVFATVSLHNWLRTQAINRPMYTPSDYIDWEDVIGGTVHPGQWRNEAQPAGIRAIGHQGGNRTSRAARDIRDDLCTYVNGVGAREWQERMIV